MFTDIIQRALPVLHLHLFKFLLNQIHLYQRHQGILFILIIFTNLFVYMQMIHLFTITDPQLLILLGSSHQPLLLLQRQEEFELFHEREDGSKNVKQFLIVNVRLKKRPEFQTLNFILRMELFHGSLAKGFNAKNARKHSIIDWI